MIRFAIKKYGVENFRKEYLVFCEDEEELNYWERVFVDETWLMRSDTYNLQTGGDHRVLSEESRRKIASTVSRVNKGRKHKEETKRKISAALKGNPKLRTQLGMKHTEEYKKYMSELRKGYKQSDAAKEKLRQINTGKHHSNEVKQKLRESLKDMRWYNNGSICIRIKDGEEIPEGFVRGRIYRKRDMLF